MTAGLKCLSESSAEPSPRSSAGKHRAPMGKPHRLAVSGRGALLLRRQPKAPHALANEPTVRNRQSNLGRARKFAKFQAISPA